MSDRPVESMGKYGSTWAIPLGGLGVMGSWDPFLERPGNLTGPKSYFKMEISKKIGSVMNSNEVHFFPLAYNFTVQFQPSQTFICNGKQNNLTCPVITGSLEKQAPCLGACPLQNILEK